MNLTNEQKEYLENNRKGNIYSVAYTAKTLAARYPEKIDFNPEDLQYLLYIFSIGETHEALYIDKEGNGEKVSIYSKEYGPWDDKARELNKTRGALSVELAQREGISLSEDEIQAVESMSTGGNINLMAIMMKMAQTYEAVKHPRWSRGEKKEPAKDFNEVSEILQDEIKFMIKNKELPENEKQNLISNLIEAARATYDMEYTTRYVGSLRIQEENEIFIYGLQDKIGPSLLTDERLAELYSKLTNAELTDLYKDMQEASRESHAGGIIEKYEKQVENRISKEDIKQAVEGISLRDTINLMDEMENNSKDKSNSEIE